MYSYIARHVNVLNVVRKWIADNAITKYVVTGQAIRIALLDFLY